MTVPKLNSIEAAWREYDTRVLKKADKPIPEGFRDILQQTFVAGFFSTLAVIQNVVTEAPDSDAAMKALDRLHEDCIAYIVGIRQGWHK